MSEQIERDIETVLEARTGRECVFMPSGRFAIHLAFQLLLSPGDRILMSPLEDDTVFFGALAAGLRPVMAPVSTHDGNIRIDAIDDATWSSISAVLTGNTYGLPDPVVELSASCSRFAIPLIEDAAHALETDIDGHPIGSFGTASAFSLSKHFAGRGGVLAVRRRSQPTGRRPIARSVHAAAADWQRSGWPRAIIGQNAIGKPSSRAGAGSRATHNKSQETYPMAGAAACASPGACTCQR